jgi:hypothetical protein
MHRGNIEFFLVTALKAYRFLERPLVSGIVNLLG